MQKQIALDDLDLTNAIEVISSQNPEVSLRVNIPIPNWLGFDGKPEIFGPGIGHKLDGAPRYFFKNPKDDCIQNVEIDGTSVITFMGATPKMAAQLIGIVLSYGDVEKMTPETLTEILERSVDELGLSDRYDNPRAGVDSYMHPYAPIQSPHKYLCASLPVPNLSAAIYIPGEGAFKDGPTSTPQIFKNGAFISFPGKPKSEILSMDSEELKKRGKARVIQCDTFLATKTYPDGKSIEPSELPKMPFRTAPKANELKL